MQIEMPRPFPIIIRLKRGLISIERDLCIDHQLLLTRHIHNRVGPQPAAFGFHRLLKVKIGMLSQPALLQNVLQGPLAPAPARFGGIGQGIAQTLRLAPDLFLPLAHRLDQPIKLSKGIHALLFQGFDLLFILLQPLSYRSQQGLELFFRSLFPVAKPFRGIFGQFFLRRAEHFRAGIFKLFQKLLAAFFEQAFLLCKTGPFRLEGGVFLPRKVELLSQTIGAPRPLGHGGKFRRCTAKFLVQRLRLAISILQAGL